MQFANAENMRLEAKPGMGGTCPDCGGNVIAKCGEYRLWHWSHIGRRDCDSWSEPETPWHRGWKGLFPKDTQEIICRSETDESHRADVKTLMGLIIEFQRSPIAPDEQRNREAFYGDRLVWVLDGTRLAGDLRRFNQGTRSLVQMTSGVLSVFLTHDPAASFPRQWLECKAPVFFDFGGEDFRVDAPLWCLLPGRAEGRALIVALSRSNFLALALTQPVVFDHGEILRTVADGLGARDKQPAPGLPGFERWLDRRATRRRRL
jgi:competence protein CoiA